MTGLPKFRVTWHYTIHRMGSRRNGEPGSYTTKAEGPDAVTAVALATLSSRNALYNRGAQVTRVEAVPIEGWVRPNYRTVAVKPWVCGELKLRRNPSSVGPTWQLLKAEQVVAEDSDFDRIWHCVLEHMRGAP